MRLYWFILAAGVLVAGFLGVPKPLLSLSWIASLLALAGWIAFGPPRVPTGAKASTDAGRIGGFGLYGASVGIGLFGSIVGLALSLAQLHNIVYAVLALTSAAAIALAVLAGPATRAISEISESKAFESRHVVWQRTLENAAARCADPAAGKQLLACAEAARYARRDLTARGFAINPRLDEAVALLCRASEAVGPALPEQVSAVRALLRERENLANESAS